MCDSNLTQAQREERKKRLVYEQKFNTMTKQERYAYIHKYGIRYLPSQHIDIKKTSTTILQGNQSLCD